MFPITTHGKLQNSVSENASSCVCRDKSVIPTLNVASAYWLLQSIDNSSRKERGGERDWGKKVWLVPLPFLSHSFIYTHIHTHAHTGCIKYAELGLAWGHVSYISIKQYIISLQLEAHDWCACHLFGLCCQPSKKCHLNTKSPIWEVTRIVFGSSRHLHLYLLSYQTRSTSSILGGWTSQCLVFRRDLTI